MNTEKNILIAFALNLAFTVFEVLGGLFTGSVTLISDAVHDFGDAVSIGAAYLFERKSKKAPNERFTYGYARFSALGGALTTLILFCGSAFVIYNAIQRILSPVAIRYDGLILFAVAGVTINLIAAYITHRGSSLNQKAVSLHMLEDVLGWVIVLIGAIVMRLTDLAILDPIMSIGVAILILVASLRGLKEVLDIFLERVPHGVAVEDIRTHAMEVEGVLDVHHIHLSTMDGQSIYATMHIVTELDPHIIKERVREALAAHGVSHTTLELERMGEECHGEQREIVARPQHKHSH